MNIVKNSGQVYTPDYLVNLILDEAGYFGSDILRKHCMENSCGEGAFLCEIVHRYCTAYREAFGSLDGVENELTEYIHGIEIDKAAYECCIENLTALCKKLGINSCHFDVINADTLNVKEYNGCMDYVIGNPPYVRVHNLESRFDAVKSFSFASGGMTDIYLVFFEIGFNMLKNGGKLCYITPSSWVNSVAGGNMRFHILTHKNLVSIVDLGHFQPFKETTYTMISLFQKGVSSECFRFYEFNSNELNKEYVCDISFEDVCINGCFYMQKNETLSQLRSVLKYSGKRYVSVKNGFATLADKVFISDTMPFTEYTIPTIKASTGKWYRAFYPYDKNGKPLPKDIIFSVHDIAEYLEEHKAELLKFSTENQNPEWYLFGRTQALKDVRKHKIAVNTTIKDINSIKLNEVPAGSGLYSGLYILTNVGISVISEILLCNDFVKYVAALRKYKSGGYYTFNSKDLELYLNFKINQLVRYGEISINPINKQGFSECNLSLF